MREDEKTLQILSFFATMLTFWRNRLIWYQLLIELIQPAFIEMDD